MTCEFNLVLRKTGLASWTLSSDKGVTLHEFTRVGDALEAERLAKVWASSWNSVDIKVIEDVATKG